MSMYNWNDVAARTEEVYRSLANVQHPTLQERLLTCAISPLANSLSLSAFLTSV